MSSMVNGDSTLDRISHLPPNIIEKILVHLPLKDAIRTSILSRDWRYAWSSIPHLVFSGQEFPLSMTNSQADFDHQIVDIIYHVLLLHQGPILRFQLSADLYSSKDIDGWLLFLSRNDIKEIVLDKWVGEVYKLPSCLLTCKGLRSLCLSLCMFRPVHFQGFPHLTTLFLERTSISQDGLEALITNCPLLNELRLIDMLDFSGLKVCSTSLVNFEFSGGHRDLSFENVPLLATLSVTFFGRTNDKYYVYPGVICKLFRNLNHLPSIKKIELGGHAFKAWTYGELPIQVPLTYQLKHFHATINIRDIQQMHAIVLLCRSCPLLLTLELEAYTVQNLDDGTSIEKFWDAQQGFDCFFSHLKSVEITGVSCISELPFIKFVLANAPVLEIANIGYAHGVKTVLHMSKEIKKFRRLSPAAKIKIFKRRTRVFSIWA